MRRALVWYGCVWLALSTAAFAEGEPPFSAQALGIAEGVASYCQSIDPAGADKVRQMIKQLVQGASAQQLAKVRNSDEYRKGYDSVAEFTGKIDAHNAGKFCSGNAVERK